MSVDAPSIGSMRRRVMVQSKILTLDGAGGQTVVWANFTTIWVEILPIKSDEKLIAGKVTQTTTHDIVTRYRTDITNDHRIVYGTRIFQINGVSIIEEKQRFLHLACAEGVGS